MLGVLEQILQLVLEDEISPDSSSVKRSQTTGHLLLDLPKAKPVLHARNAAVPKLRGNQVRGGAENAAPDLVNRGQSAPVERGQSVSMDPMKGSTAMDEVREKANTQRTETNKTQRTHDFEDDPDVPPLM